MLSQESLKRFHRGHQIPNNTQCRWEGAEDAEIAKCLRQQDVYVGNSTDEQGRELFHPLTFYSHFSGSFPDWMDEYAMNPLRTVSDC